MSAPKARPVVGKWFIRIWIDPNGGFVYNDRFARTLHVAFLRMKRTPPEGVMPTAGRDYAGFHFRLAYRVPAMVEAWR